VKWEDAAAVVAAVVVADSIHVLPVVDAIFIQSYCDIWSVLCYETLPMQSIYLHAFGKVKLYYVYPFVLAYCSKL
jgi:hypothetical protein